jgi:hypothetical protein
MTSAQVQVAGQPVHGPFDHLCLRRREPAVAHRFGDRRQTGLSRRGREPNHRRAGALVAARRVGHEVLCRGPAGTLHRAGGLELAHHPELECVQGRLQRLDLGDDRHQLTPGVGCPQRLRQIDRPRAQVDQLGDDGARRVRHR